MARMSIVALAMFASLAGLSPAAAASNPVKHVLVVGFDGLSPEGIRIARTPHLDELMKTGAYTLRARGVMPTSSSPNWASMIMGAGPEQHGVTSNDWRSDKFQIAPVAVGPGGIFPTVFSVLRQQEPSAHIAVFHDWEGFKHLVERGVPDVMEHRKGHQQTVARAAPYLKSHKPRLMFVHLDHIDHAGHDHGHGSPQYVASVEEGDRLLGVLLTALNEADMRNSTLVLVGSDHGMVGTKHGQPTTAEIEIPWIVQGPGVARGREIKTPVNIYDTAATIAHFLALKPPAAWIGRFVSEAVED